MHIELEVAEGLSKKIKRSGEVYTSNFFPAISGSNTSGCTEVNEICSKISGILSDYQNDALRDGENIQVLATYFKEKDEEASNKIKKI